MPTIFADEAGDHACPWNDFAPCLGPKCMAWAWRGKRFEHCETDNLVETEEGTRPIGSPTTPEGDGWRMDGPPRSKSYHQSKKLGLPPGLSQSWVRDRKLVDGSCDRGGRDNEYW